MRDGVRLANRCRTDHRGRLYRSRSLAKGARDIVRELMPLHLQESVFRSRRRQRRAPKPRPSSRDRRRCLRRQLPVSATFGIYDCGYQRHRCNRPRTWPPASQPWATTTSTPHSTARLAAAAVPTVWRTVAPPAFARGTSGDGSRQMKEMTGTPSSRHTARRSS